MSKQDEKIQTLLKTIENKKEKMGKRPRATLHTNGLFLMPNDDRYNLNTISDEEVLIEMLRVLLMNKSYRDEACKRLGVEDVKEFTWQGFTLDDWEHDLKLRASMVMWDKENKKLALLEKKLKELVSEETKTQMEIDDIEKMLS